MNQESRTLLAITFILAAVFVAMNRIVESAPIGDWWLALALFVIGAVFALATRFDLASGRTIEEMEAQAAAPALSRVHVFEFAPVAAAPQLGGAQAAAVEEEPIPVDDTPIAEAASENDLPLGEVIVDEPAPPPVNGASPDTAEPQA